jgi:uncharacterized protein
MALPSFHLNELSDEPLTVSSEVQPDELGVIPEEAVVRGGLLLTMTVSASGKLIDVHGDIAGTFVRECVRCLKEYEERIQLPFSVRYRMPDVMSGGRSRGKPAQEPDAFGPAETPEEDEDTYVCTGERVEPAEMLREHIILATPIQPLCDENCQGLCPVCGRDRNQAACGCIEPAPMNPFASLQQRWKKPGESRGH